MRRRSFLSAVTALSAGTFTAASTTLTAPAALAATSSLVRVQNGKLVYTPFANNGETAEDNVIPDFSHAGYRAGQALPSRSSIPVRETLSPADSGDDTSRIQAAIDRVSQRSPDAAGFRGAVLLRQGRYRIGSTVKIMTGGVVLRGEGQDVTGGTILEATGTSQYDALAVGTDPAESSSTGAPIVEDESSRGRSPAASSAATRSVAVDSISGYTVGDRIVVVRTPNDHWIDELDIAQLRLEVCGLRRLLRAEDHLDLGLHRHHRHPARAGDHRGRRQQTHREVHHARKNLKRGRGGSCTSCPRSPPPLTSSTDGTRSPSKGYRTRGSATLSAALFRVFDGEHPRHCPSGHRPGLRIPRRQIPGDRRTALCLRDQWHEHLQPVPAVVLARWPARLRDGLEGPRTQRVPRLRRRGTRLRTPGHRRYATGVLFDGVTTNFQLNVQNRKASGTGHGWAGAQTRSGTHRRVPATSWSRPSVPATGRSAVRRRAGAATGNFESFGTAVTPRSLYLQQLQDRLGTSGRDAVTVPAQRSGSITSLLTDWAGEDGPLAGSTGCGPAPAPAPGPGPPCRPKKLSRAARNADAARPRTRSPARPRRRHGDTDVGLENATPSGVPVFTRSPGESVMYCER